ncbi:hypothetical protein CBZ35_003760, partial [Salmonella enterica]|nr:hypothetical protein [Salmonella enterica]
ITELLSTNDPDTLRQLALSLLEENRKKDASLSEKDHQIHLMSGCTSCYPSRKIL